MIISYQKIIKRTILCRNQIKNVKIKNSFIKKKDFNNLWRISNKECNKLVIDKDGERQWKSQMLGSGN